MNSSRSIPHEIGAGCRAFACLLAALSLARADTVPLPQPLPSDRYDSVWVRSPFTLAVSPDDAPKGTWALVGLTQDDNGPFVILLNRQTQERMAVTKQPNDRGFAVEEVDDNPDLLQSSARIRTPAEVLVVRFDPALTVIAAQTSASGQSGAAAKPSSKAQITHTAVPRPIPKAKPPSS